MDRSTYKNVNMVFSWLESNR